jgi:deoxyribonuclease V
MNFPTLHAWNLTPTAAVALQKELAGRVRSDVPLQSCNLIAGADCSYNRFSTTIYAGVVVLRADDLRVVERQGAVGETTFPYVPGLLTFREAPTLLQAFAKLEHVPDLVVCDGQGVAHPRRIGFVSHVGLWLNVPCVGCAKTRLVGSFTEPDREAGSSTPLFDRGDVIGRVVRSKTGVKPLFVSSGHLIDIHSAVRWVLATTRKYRVPEPTRLAHHYVNALRRGEESV